MSKKLYEESSIQAIADAIRTKNGTQSTYKTSQMPNAILNINPEPDLETLSVSQNGNYVPSSGKDGFSSVSVAVPNAFTVSDEGKVVKNGALVAQTSRNISANGTYDTTENNSVIVDVSGGGGGGTASFDNIIVGSSAPDASIGTPGDVYIRALTNRVDGRAYHRMMGYLYKTSQNTWATAPDYTLPYPRVSLRVVTHSTGGGDASIDFYAGQTLIKNILYNTVTGASGRRFDDLFGLYIGYSATAPDGVWTSGWCIYTPIDSSVIYNGETISPNSLIQRWNYSTSVDFTIEV